MVEEKERGRKRESRESVVGLKRSQGERMIVSMITMERKGGEPSRVKGYEEQSLSANVDS